MQVPGHASAQVQSRKCPDTAIQVFTAMQVFSHASVQIQPASVTAQAHTL